MTTLREEMENEIEPFMKPAPLEKTGINFVKTEEMLTQRILLMFEKRIDVMIQVDYETLQRDLGTKEGKIAAQASKNTLTLVKEMLK